MPASGASGSVPHPLQPPPAAAQRAQPSSPRRWYAIDEHPRWIALAASELGRTGIFLVFGAMLLVELPLRAAAIIVAGAAAAAFLRTQRDRAVLAATLLALLFDPEWYMDAAFASYLTTLALGFDARDAQRLLTGGLFVATALVLRTVAQHPDSTFAKRPVLSLLGIIALASALCVALPHGPIASWLALAIKLLGVYMWFICYAVIDQRSAQRGSITRSLGVIHPFWGSTSTPIGKGSGYLAKLRCEGREDLAVVQLKALKLLAWALVLRGVSTLLIWAANWAGVPSLELVVGDFRAGRPAAIGVGWLSLVLAVTLGTVELAIWGHRVVACARLAGWKLRRNTWRPLESRSLADFWNRYYYYFKELLLDCFFYPTFFRYFKKRPRLRTFCATFMAAGVGNCIYHFVRDIDRVFSLGPLLALQSWGSYTFYCTALAAGIAISQVRTGTRPAGSFGFVDRARAFVSVWGFVVLLHVFGGLEDRSLTFGDRLAFLLHQFGV